MDDTQEPTPSGQDSPLIESEGSALPTLNDTPLANARASTVVTTPPTQVSTAVIKDEPETDTLSFVQQLREIEAKAIAEMSTWDATYLGEATVTTPGTSTVARKRKASNVDIESDNDSASSSSSDEGDEDDRVSPLDPDKQDRPKLPIYHPGFPLTEDLTKNILSILNKYVTTAMRSGYKDKEATHLREEILNSRNILYQESVRLAVAGDTGAGKSALLNAIIGVVNLNIESDAGGACTCVITEFQQSPSTQTAPYAAEVEFFDINVCRQLVKDLFTQWFLVKQKQRQNSDDVDDDDLNRMKTARDCIQQMFAERLGFETAENFMGNATSPNDMTVLGQLLKWTTDIHQKFIQEGQMSVYFEASTPETLMEQYHPFTREVPNASFRGQPLRFTPWPLVRIVRVFLDSPILRQNEIIADVPGVSDTNYFRVENANRYLQSCDMTIVVGKIDRLQDNSSFQQQYMDAFRRRRSGSVILVATRSDELNEENNSTSTLDTAAQEQLAAVHQKISEVEQDIQIIDNEMDFNRLKKNTKANKKLKRRKKRLTRRKNGLEKQRKDILIASRNKQVTSITGRNYRDDTGDDAGAPMFCVSNRMFMRHLRGYDKTDERSVPTMTPEQTQIPALCSYIYVLPSKGRTASLNHFVHVTVPTLLSIIQMSCSTTSLARATHLTGIVQKSRKALEFTTNGLVDKFCSTDIELLHDQLSNYALQTKFDTPALKNLEKWEALAPATHRAIVRKNGTYTQKKKSIYTNWNDDLSSPVRPIIDTAFRNIIDQSTNTFKAEAAQISKEVIRELDATLKNDPQALACNAYNVCFRDNLKRFYDDIDRHVEKAAKSLKDALIQVHISAVGLKKDDYFPEAMRDVYEEAWAKKSAVKGQTMKDARCQYLREAIPGPTGPFPVIAGRAKDDASEAIKTASQGLGESLDEMLRKVQVAFDNMKKKKESDTPEGKRFRTELHQLVDEARRILQGVVQESLELCKQYK
ncbi:Nn.00g044340.m01.CDS01 [Neocucurbitaria sp. VM-36]